VGLIRPIYPVETLTLANFKLIKKAQFEFSRFNILIGPNGSGKSSIVHGLAYVAQLLGNTTPYVIPKNITELRNRGQPNQPFSIIIKGKVPALLSESVRVIHPSFFDSLLFEFSLRVTERQRQYFKLKLLLPDSSELDIHKAGEKYTIPGTNYTIRIDQHGHVVLPFRTSQSTVSYVSQPAENLVENSIRSSIRLFVPTLRGRVEYSTQPGVLGPDFSGIFTLIAGDPSFKGKLGELLSRILGYKIDLELRYIEQERGWALENQAISPSINYAIEAFGAHQLTYLLAYLLSASTGHLITIEEPEIHLHPKAQSKLVEVLADYAKDKNIQLIITTHSEHILLKFLNLVAKGVIDSKELKVYYFEREEPFYAHIEELEVTAKGELKGGLKGFFEEEVKLLEEYIKARASRG